MTKLICALLLTVPFASAASADSASDLDAWFRDGYAALYKEKAWEHADEFRQYFADVIAYRTDDGLVTSDVNGFLLDSLEAWRNEGWVGSDVESLETKVLNATTAMFDIKWKDRSTDGSVEFECGWYFADKIDGEWLLSQYIVTPCD